LPHPKIETVAQESVLHRSKRS